MIFKIAEPDFWHKINESFGSGGGIYILSCLADDSIDASMLVKRLLGDDQDGVLYIGMANSFLDRVINLKKSLSPIHITQAHECGVRYKNHEGINSRFPYDRLIIKLIPFENPCQAEHEALNKYVQKFGELPPLNRMG